MGAPSSFLLGYVSSIASSLALLKLSSTVEGAGTAFASFGLGAGAVFTIDLGLRFWVDRESSSFPTAFLIKSSLALSLAPLIVLLNPLALPFLVMEPLMLFADLLMSEGRVGKLALSFAVSGFTKVSLAVLLLGLGWGWKAIYSALLLGEALGHAVRVISAKVPPVELKLREVRSVLPEVASMHLSTSVVPMTQTLGTGIVGILEGPRAALEFYVVISIAGALWGIPNYLLSLSSALGKLQMWGVVALSLVVATSSPFLSQALGYEGLEAVVSSVSLATIPTAMAYSSYGLRWKLRGSVWRFCVVESIFRIVLYVLGVIYFGLVAIALVQAASMTSVFFYLRGLRPSGGLGDRLSRGVRT